MKCLGAGQNILLAALIGILALTVVWAVSASNTSGEAVMDKQGWIARGLRTLLVGCGLIALMFFGGRRGYDEGADLFRRKSGPPPE
jgi:hypothetical protein